MTYSVATNFDDDLPGRLANLDVHEGRWDGNLLDLLGPKGSPPRRRRLPFVDALRHLGIRQTMDAVRRADSLLDPSLPWVVDNRDLDGLLLENGCTATGCDICGHCAQLAARAVTPRIQ